MLQNHKIGCITVCDYAWWRYIWRAKDKHLVCGIFRNRMGIKPGRWGFYFLGLEIGSRNPGNKFGLRLKKAGLWPW